MSAEVQDTDVADVDPEVVAAIGEAPVVADGGEVTSEETPVGRRRARVRERERDRSRGEVMSPPLREARNLEDQALVDWYQSLGASGTGFRVQVFRTEPQKWKGHSVGGMVGSYERLVDEDSI